MTAASTNSPHPTRPAVPNVLSIAARTEPRTHLVVLLHGVGGDAASFHDVARTLAPALPHAELLVPDGFHPFDGGGPGRQWFSVRGVTEENRPARVREAGTELSRWIDGELARRGLSGEHLVLVGFSQGAIVSAWLTAHRSPAPAAAVLLSGRVADDSGRVADDGGATKQAKATAVFWGHGARDPVMPVSLVEPGARLLETWGARVTTRVYPGLAHHVDARELGDVGEFLKTVLRPA